MENTTYEKINPIGELDELKIYVWYCKGRGIYVNLRPVHREGYCETSMLMSPLPEGGMSVLVKEVKRKSQKQEDLIYSKIAPYSKTFAEMYDMRLFDELQKRILEVIK